MPSATLAQQRKQFTWYALQWLFKPYLWGGENPLSGVDCSGLVVDCFKSIGYYFKKEDYTANGIYQKYAQKTIAGPEARSGCLVFFLDDRHIATHVAILINNWQIIHATHGGSTTTTFEEAVRRDAYVKVRGLAKVIEQRQAQAYIIVDPFAK